MPVHTELRDLIFDDQNPTGNRVLRKFRTSRCPGRPRERWDELALQESQAMANALGLSVPELLRGLKKQSVQKKAYQYLPPPSGVQYASGPMDPLLLLGGRARL